MERIPMSAIGIGHERGLTLLELLIVIVLLGILAGLGAQALPGTDDDLERRMVSVEQALRQARQAALQRRTPIYVRCDQLSSSPDDRQITQLSIHCERDGRFSSRIGFFPDGSSSGERISISLESRIATIRLDWLSGRFSRD